MAAAAAVAVNQCSQWPASPKLGKVINSTTDAFDALLLCVCVCGWIKLRRSNGFISYEINASNAFEPSARQEHKLPYYPGDS